MATLLPNGEQTFVDPNGVPLAGGSVYFYIPSTTTPKDTYQDSDGNVLNTNPIILDAAGRAIIYGSGTYRQVVYDSAGNLQWDQLTASTDSGGVSWGGTSTGSANAQTISAGSFSSQDGQQVSFIVGVGLTNTSSLTLTLGSGSPIPVLVDTPSGPTALTGGEVAAGATVTVIYDLARGAFHLTNPAWVVLEHSSSPSGTAVGNIQWDSSANALVVGNGSSQSTFSNDSTRSGRILTPNNVGFTAAINGGALTITLVGSNGSAPSATNPVLVPFRSATAATGVQTVLTVTSATTFVISSGSTLGFSNATASRFWIVAFNDAGTFRLGVINCRSGTSIYPLRDGIYSSTAEGGAGGADSAQVFYTGTAVSSKAMTILGYMEWSSGLTAAGTWDALPTTVQVFEPGIAKPGETLQVNSTDYSAAASGTTVIPTDNTIPQITEGDQYMSQAIVPIGAPNLLYVDVWASFGCSGNQVFGMALFRDATASALAAYAGNAQGATSSPHGAMLKLRVLAAAVSSTTFTIRAGPGSSTTLYFGNQSGTRLYGAIPFAGISVTEIMA